MILCRIQAHPSRTHLHRRLMDALEPLWCDLLVHASDPPDPWANYKRCLDYDGDADHLLIIQDDALPVPGFAAAVEQIAEANPDIPTCLFMGAYPAATAARVKRSKPGTRYVPLGPTSFMPLVAVLWPTWLAQRFLKWSDGQRGLTRADDGNAARFLKSTRIQAVVAVPSIVQHDDGQPSVKGGREHTPWAEGWRQALFLADDATHYDWSGSGAGGRGSNPTAVPVAPAP